MSMKSRYNFTRNIYKDYVIFIVKNKKLYWFDQDKRILSYLNFNNKLSKLRYKEINYLVLDELDIMEIREYDNNNYRKYLLLSYLKDILLEMRKINE